MIAPPPASEAELMARARRIAGRTLGELACACGHPPPADPRRDKGWAGQLLEAVLGASAGSLAEPDFQAIGVELKTVPVGPDGRPRESTYVTAVPLLGEELHWEDSGVRRKLARVLWVPIESAPGTPIEARRVVEPLLWSPDEAEEAALRADWEELMDMVSLGRLDEVTAHYGTVLQIRPKGRDSRARVRAIGPDGTLGRRNPRGFYLRPSFTAAVLRAVLGAAPRASRGGRRR